jgi:hypothetical protein
MSIKVYGMRVRHSHNPTDGQPPASSQKMKEEMGEHFGASFFLSPLQCTVVYSITMLHNKLAARMGKNEHLLPYLQNGKNRVHVLESER